MPQLEQLSAELDRLAAFEPGPFPVVSLYLNLRPDSRGRDSFAPFLRKELGDRIRTFAAGGPEEESLRSDARRIEEYLAGVDPASNGLALFACGGAGLFDAFQLAAPIDEHRLFVAERAHLYPLARLLGAYRRYLVLLADTHSARLFVFAANTVEQARDIENPKTKRHKVGGTSQARYQRHVDNDRLHHIKEIAEAIAGTVRREGIEHVILAGDGLVAARVRDQLSREIAERIADTVRLHVRASEREIVDRTIAALHGRDAETDHERVDAVLCAYRANGLAVIGAEATRRALDNGQVDELLIAVSGGVSEDEADDLIARARNTSARVRFVGDASLLEPAGGVGASLRYRAGAF